MTINKIYMWLISTFFLWFVLAIYFDNVVPNPYGVRKSAIYFLRLGYWTGKGGNKAKEGGICSCRSSALQVEHITLDVEDVLEEENRVKQQVAGGEVDPNVAVQIRGLAKIYPGARRCCCSCKRRSPFHALKGIWVNFAKDQLFCLLGPNGAGKTTVINCLTGIMPVTAGDALIHGYSIRRSTGMSKIRRMIGVCPQFDILWDALNGEEHLCLFASIKGLPLPSIEDVIRESLHEVRLTHAARVRASSYKVRMLGLGCWFPLLVPPVHRFSALPCSVVDVLSVSVSLLMSSVCGFLDQFAVRIPLPLFLEVARVCCLCFGLGFASTDLRSIWLQYNV